MTGIIAMLLGLAGGAAWNVQSAMQVRSTATEFVQAVKTARQYAIDHGCRVRLAFRPGLYDPALADTAAEAERSYRLYTFVVPSSAPGDAGRWIQVANPAQASAAGVEWTRVELAPRSASLVGRWIACPLDPKPKRVPARVAVSGELFDRFRSAKPAEFFAENFLAPETVWTPRNADPHAEKNCLSVFPGDYWQTPADQGPVLLTGPLPSSERCFDPITGTLVSAESYWPGTVRFFGAIGQSGKADLPGIEFAADGSLACTWTPQLELRFASPQRNETGYLVVIDARTGLPRVVEEEAR